MALTLVCSYHTDPVHYFDDRTRRPCTGLCGHTVCLECITRDLLSRCPVCELSGAFSKISVNYTSNALLEDCRKRFLEELRRWVNTKNRGAGFCSNFFKEIQLFCSICAIPVKIPRICLTCEKETLFKLNRWNWRHDNSIILKLLQRVMCADCAIDNHGGHDIKKHIMDKRSKKLITMATARKVLNMFKDAIENEKCVIDCFLRRLKIEIIGQNLLKVIEELEYIEEWECGYLGELVRQELIKNYMENVDEKMLDLFVPEENLVCDCTRFHEELRAVSRTFEDVKRHRALGIKPQVFESGCPLYSWDYMDLVRREYSISEKEFGGVAATVPPKNTKCPLCAYNGYSQHQRKDVLLKKGVSVIEELCKTEMIPLDKCCLNCLDILNDCQFLLSCEHRKKRPHSFHFTNWYREKKLPREKKNCYQNCFINDSSVWNFVIINHMMADNNLREVIAYEMEQTVGFVDCQLRKVQMKSTVNELYEGLNSVRFWEYFDHLSIPFKMDALLESFRKQWNSFRIGHGEQETALQCKCTFIWNKIQENKLEKEKYKDLETKMIDMARYSMKGELHGCPMEYNHGIELDMDAMKELEETVCVNSTRQETELTSVGDEKFMCMMKRLVSNIFPFAHLHCQNEEKQRFDSEIHQPYTGSCGHTICLVCIEKTINEDCPVCGKEGSFEGHQLNEDLLREIDTIRENAWEMFKELWNNEAAGSGACSECNKSSLNLYICDIDFDNFIIRSGWKKRFLMKSTANVLKLSRHVLCEECASVEAHTTVKVNTIPFWKKYLRKTNGIFLLELLEDDIGEENCESRHVEIQKNRKQLIKALEELNYEEKQECGYKTQLIKLKSIEKLIEHLDRSAKQQQQPIEEKNCPLCIMIDYLDRANNRSERNGNDWMNVFEHLWSSQSPRFDKCCIRCLLYLNNGYSVWCHTETEKKNIKRMSSAISERIEARQFKNFHRTLAKTPCIDCVCRQGNVDDKEIWQNLIIREYFLCLLQTMTEGLSRTTFSCHLRKIRIHNLAYHFLSEVCEALFYSNQPWIVFWEFFKTSSMINNLNIQFKKLKNEMDKDGFKCECTDIWERIQNMMKKIGHKDSEEKKKYQDLEDSMEEIARFSIEEDLSGCPMKYNHGIELDEESVRILKETIDFEAETDGNKCLCVQIDTLGTNSSISEINLHQIVSLFITWWKYESLYPHFLCQMCVNRLDLIEELFWELHESHKFLWSVKEKFTELCFSFHEYQLIKGRVFREDIEEMTRVFKDFLSEWNSLPLPPIQSGPTVKGQQRKNSSRVFSCC